jgi:hypothetical protein
MNFCLPLPKKSSLLIDSSGTTMSENHIVSQPVNFLSFAFLVTHSYVTHNHALETELLCHCNVPYFCLFYVCLVITIRTAVLVAFRKYMWLSVLVSPSVAISVPTAVISKLWRAMWILWSVDKNRSWELLSLVLESISACTWGCIVFSVFLK